MKPKHRDVEDLAEDVTTSLYLGYLVHQRFHEDPSTSMEQVL